MKILDTTLPTSQLVDKLDSLGLTRIASLNHWEELDEAVRSGPAKWFHTIPEIAAHLQFRVRDVYSWIKWGKRGKNGDRLFLETTEFWPGAHIVTWQAVLAYGIGIPLKEYVHEDVPQMVGVEFGIRKYGQVVHRRRGKPSPKVYDSEKILRVTKPAK